jgi:antitoxin (DNA-binding transcriptional repressor) of toxin-antitoxin stability system
MGPLARNPDPPLPSVMRTVGLKILKSKLGEYVRLAKGGETVLVTDQDEVVAELGPPRQPRGNRNEPVIAAGVAEGWLTPARIRGAGPPPRPEPTTNLPELLEELTRDREDR